MTRKQDEARAAFPHTPTGGARMINGNDLVREYAAAHPDEPMPPYLFYRGLISGRAYQSAAWQVIRPGTKTDPDGHWRDYGNKTFNVFHISDRAAQLEEAKAWCAKQYGVTEWKRTARLHSYTDWFPAFVVDWLETVIKERMS